MTDLLFGRTRIGLSSPPWRARRHSTFRRCLVQRSTEPSAGTLAVAEGADVAAAPILSRSEETVFDKAGLANVKVTAKVVAHVRGEKLRVFKFKPKRGYKRRTGHRQDLTQIEVLEITAGGAKAPAKATAKPAPAKAPDSDAEAAPASATKEKAADGS